MSYLFAEEQRDVPEDVVQRLEAEAALHWDRCVPRRCRTVCYEANGRKLRVAAAMRVQQGCILFGMHNRFYARNADRFYKVETVCAAV
jgi:hypothetical protein